MLIRRMKAEDIPAAVQIEKQCFSQPWSEKSFLDSISREDTIFLVYELTDEGERRTNHPPIQMHGVLSDGGGGFLYQLEMEKLQLTSSEAACVHEQAANVDCECPLYGTDCQQSHAETAESPNRIAGYIGMYLSFDEASITNVAVLPEYRNMGIGKQLVAHAQIAAKNAAVETIFLEVRVSNIPAISLYKKMGFQELGIRKNFYDHPVEDAYIMSCI